MHSDIDATAENAAARWLIAGRVAMPHVNVPEPVAGIRGLMAARPASGLLLSGLAEHLLRGDSPLTEGERELIAAYVSHRDETGSVRRDQGRPLVGERMRALLLIAGKVRRDARTVTAKDVAAARAAGADDEAIHDTVLIASVFCMFHSYADALGSIAPNAPAVHDEIDAYLAAHGCLLAAG